jgi:hypothetical protein
LLFELCASGRIINPLPVKRLPSKFAPHSLTGKRRNVLSSWRSSRIMGT